jgi:plasmid stabilization system protein ParE
MELIIYWTDFAKNELKNIFNYHKEKASLKIARKIILKIIKTTNDLSKFPEMGAQENLLIERPQNFRYLISTNYKIIYWINHKKTELKLLTFLTQDKILLKYHEKSKYSITRKMLKPTLSSSLLLQFQP